MAFVNAKKTTIGDIGLTGCAGPTPGRIRQEVAFRQRRLVNRNEGPKGLLSDDEAMTLMWGGEIAGRIADLPPVKELVERVANEAEEIILGLPQKLAKQ